MQLGRVKRHDEGFELRDLGGLVRMAWVPTAAGSTEDRKVKGEI